jgi:Tol biopolymer transport system component
MSGPGANGDSDVFLVNPVTGETVTLIEGPADDEGPAIARVGTLVAYSSDRGGVEFDIFVADLDAGTDLPVTTNPDREVSPDWSPDGTRIAFRGRVDENSDIYVVTVATGEVTRLTDDPAFDGDARWSPDGSQILFSSTRGGSYDLWVMNSDGSNQTRLTDHPADEEYPTWSNDGRFVAFQSNRYGFQQVWLMRADGSDESLLVGAHPSAYPTFGPPGALEAVG